MKIRYSLLIDILNNRWHNYKYSDSFLKLKSIIELEKTDTQKLPSDFFEKFKEIEKSYNSFINNIPLKVIELYFYRYQDKPNYYMDLEFQNKELKNYKVIEIYLLLEDFYNKIYLFATQIANYYSIEIKINEKISSENIKTI